jgi:hypothetical protein
MVHLNELNVKLQGQGKVIYKQAQHVQEFKSELNLLLAQIQKDDLTHFANLARFIGKKKEERGLLDVNLQF